MFITLPMNELYDLPLNTATGHVPQVGPIASVDPVSIGYALIVVGISYYVYPPESNGALSDRYSLSKRAPCPIGRSFASPKLDLSSGPFLLLKR